MNFEYIMNSLAKSRKILISKVNEKIEVVSSENFECYTFEYKHNNFVMVRYLETDEEKLANKEAIRHNYECAYEDHNYPEAIKLLLKYISMCSELNAEDIYQVGQMYMKLHNYSIAREYLLLACHLCNSREYKNAYYYCCQTKNYHRKDLINSDKLNLIINDILLNIGAIDQIIDEYELTNEEKLIVKIYLAQELYKYRDIKRAEKIILSIKKMEYHSDIVEGLLEYTEKNRALIAKQRKRTLHKDED